MTKSQGPITDRINLESFKIIIDSMEEGVVIQDPENQVIAFNPAALRILGFQEEELLGRTSNDNSWQSYNEDLSVCKPEDHPSVIAKKTLKTCAGRVVGLRSKLRGLRWIRVTAVPVLHDSLLSHIVITFVDITAEREARAEIEEKKRTLRATIDSVPMAISYWGTDLRNVNSNRAFAEIYKVESRNSMGMHLRDVIGPELFADDQIYIQDALGGKARWLERHRQGSSVMVGYVPNLIQGQVQGICVVETDVSEIRHLEQERREVEMKLMHSARWAALGEMAGNIAHEINNPLTAIKIRISLLLSNFENNKVDASGLAAGLRSIEKIVDRIAKIVSALNYIARDGEEDEFQNYSLKKCVEDALEIARQRIELSGVRLEFVCEKDEIVYCRPVQISQVIMNLVANAFDAVQELEEKWIRISLKTDANATIISVVDSGHGIEEGLREQIMTPFFTTKMPGRGVGLGLSLSKDIVEKHGGSLFYDQEDGRTCFRIVFKKS